MLLATALALALAAPAAPPILPWTMNEQRLDNGLRIVVIPTDKSGSFAMYEMVGTGSRDEVEAGHSGFAHFFEHMMFRGTKKYPADARTALLAKLGVDEGGYTTDDFTGYSLQGPKQALDELFTLEADRFANLEYSEDDFKTESRAVLGEYNKNFSNPDEKAYEALANLAFDAHTYKHTTMGFLKDIERMPKEFAYSRDFFRRFYTPDNVLIVIAGDVDPAAVQAKAKAAFSSWKGTRQVTKLDDEPALTAPRSLVVEWANPTQRRVHLGWRVPSAVDDPKQAALGLLLKAYLFSNSSDLVKGLVLGGKGAEAPAEQVDCWWDVHKDASLFPVAVRVKDGADVAAVVDRVQAELDAVAAGKVNDRRFNDVKSNLRYSLLMSFTSADRIAGTLAWMTGPSMNPGFTEALFAALADTSVVELQRYVSTSFSAQQRATVELHHTAATGAAK
jgi:zinc protease